MTIASTKYWFGPGRNPRITIGVEEDPNADTFVMNAKNYILRTICFDSAKWGRFEWRYCGRKERAQVGNNINSLLVLEKIIDVPGVGDHKVRVAQLIRSEETRTPGTRATHAGNGGRLEMHIADGDEIMVDEVTVVVTCLVMLKKEIDRLRAMQAMMMSGGGGGP